MKTDKQRFIELYKSFGIELNHSDECRVITLNEGDDDKFEGYLGFFSDVEFDDDGKFVKQSFWE